jgi:hypothetical protein
MQMRMAAISPALAMSTALRAMASASSSNRFWNRIVARLRDPRGRPDGFPLWPFWNSMLGSPSLAAKNRGFTRSKSVPRNKKPARWPARA